MFEGSEAAHNLICILNFTLYLSRIQNQKPLHHRATVKCQPLKILCFKKKKTFFVQKMKPNDAWIFFSQKCLIPSKSVSPHQ